MQVYLMTTAVGCGSQEIFNNVSSTTYPKYNTPHLATSLGAEVKDLRKFITKYVYIYLHAMYVI